MFINQINNGTIAVRRIDEGGMDEDSGMNFAEFVAILSGNNDLLNKTKLDNKIMQLENCLLYTSVPCRYRLAPGHASML